MTRISVIILLALLAGCADQSKGSALNECRMKHYLDAGGIQQQSIPECMKAKSFEMLTDCAPEPDENESDWPTTAFPYNNPGCYHAVGAAAWTATLLSPM